MKVAIIGCGYSGLSAIRRCTEMNINCVAFELSGQVGGLWVYTEKVGTDEFGIPIQTSLYDSVRTNGPKQTLEFDDFKFETEEDTCYPRHHEVRRFLDEFATHFNLSEHIKFYHYVTKVSRVGNKWHLQVRDLKAQNDEKYEFDAVMICNGHTTKPFIPQIKGIESFSGLQLHSHDYRRGDVFTNKRVLVIGNAASGIEIACESSSVAEKTYLTYRNESEVIQCPNIILKKNVKMISTDKVIFLDDSSENIDVIVYCTGYQYYFPFLDASCGITVEDDGQIVKPLYKHYININEPTMCFVGLFQRTIISYLFDFQVQAFLKFLTNKIKLPSYEEMIKWLDEENKRKFEQKIPRNRYYHHSSENIEEYFNDITSYAGLKNIPPVLFKIFKKNEQVYVENFFNLRRLYFEIIDDENYICYFKAAV